MVFITIIMWAPHQQKKGCQDFETEKETRPTPTPFLVGRPTPPGENLQEGIDFEEDAENEDNVDDGHTNDNDTSIGRRKKRKRRWRRGRPRCSRQGVKPGPLGCSQKRSGSHRGEWPHKGDIVSDRFWTILTFSSSELFQDNKSTFCCIVQFVLTWLVLMGCHNKSVFKVSTFLPSVILT